MQSRPSTPILPVSIGIVAAMALILFSMGRVPFCECGVIRLWSGDIWSNQNSQQFWDPYTFTHILHGTVLYGLLWLALGKRASVATRFLLALTFEAAWEVFENTDFVINRYREATISLDYYGDSIFNSIGDTAAMAAGFWAAHRLPARATAAASVVMDVALLFWIRDSLALNVIMLIYPIEAIRQWQLH